MQLIVDFGLLLLESFLNNYSTMTKVKKNLLCVFLFAIITPLSSFLISEYNQNNGNISTFKFANVKAETLTQSNDNLEYNYNGKIMIMSFSNTLEEISSSGSLYIIFNSTRLLIRENIEVYNGINNQFIHINFSPIVNNTNLIYQNNELSCNIAIYNITVELVVNNNSIFYPSFLISTRYYLEYLQENSNHKLIDRLGTYSKILYVDFYNGDDLKGNITSFPYQTEYKFSTGKNHVICEINEKTGHKWTLSEPELWIESPWYTKYLIIIPISIVIIIISKIGYNKFKCQ